MADPRVAKEESVYQRLRHNGRAFDEGGGQRDSAEARLHVSQVPLRVLRLDFVSNIVSYTTLNPQPKTLFLRFRHSKQDSFSLLSCKSSESLKPKVINPEP